MSLTWSPGLSMGKEELDSFLGERLLARVASVRPDGYPHATPIIYLWDGEALWFILGNGERPRQHIGNLRENPKLCVIVDRDTRQERGGGQDAQGVTIRGVATLSSDEELQEEVVTKLMRRYYGSEGDARVDRVLQDGKPGRNRVVVKVEPEKIISWDFRKLHMPG